MIERPLYVDKIMAYVDTPFVKILTGVRRCGKSTILKMIMERLKTERNIPEDRIISCRFDSMEYEDMTEWMGVDYSYLDIDRIQSTAKQAAGKRLNELRRHEFDVNGEPPAELRYFYDLHSEILDNPDLEWVGDMEP